MLGPHPKATEVQLPVCLTSFPSDSHALQSSWLLRSSTSENTVPKSFQADQSPLWIRFLKGRKTLFTEHPLIIRWLIFRCLIYFSHWICTKTLSGNYWFPHFKGNWSLERFIHLPKRNWWCWDSNQELLASKAVSMTPGHLPTHRQCSLWVPGFSHFPNDHQQIGAGPDDGLVRPRRNRGNKGNTTFFTKLKPKGLASILR